MPTFSAMPLHGIMFEISRFLDSNLSWPAGTRPAAMSSLCRRGGTPGAPDRAIKADPVHHSRVPPNKGESLSQLWCKSSDCGKGTNHVGADTNHIVERWVLHHPRGWGGRYVDRTAESRAGPKGRGPPSRSRGGPLHRLGV